MGQLLSSLMGRIEKHDHGTITQQPNGKNSVYCFSTLTNTKGVGERISFEKQPFYVFARLFELPHSNLPNDLRSV